MSHDHWSEIGHSDLKVSEIICVYVRWPCKLQYTLEQPFGCHESMCHSQLAMQAPVYIRAAIRLS